MLLVRAPFLRKNLCIERGKVIMIQGKMINTTLGDASRHAQGKIQTAGLRPEPGEEPHSYPAGRACRPGPLEHLLVAGQDSDFRSDSLYHLSGAQRIPIKSAYPESA